MVVRNGWYVWRVKYSKPTFKATFKWYFTSMLLTKIRLLNIITTAKRKEALTEALQDRENQVRQGAANALGKMGEKAVAAVPFLIEALEDDFAFGRGHAATALGRIGKKAARAIPALIIRRGNPSFIVIKTED